MPAPSATWSVRRVYGTYRNRQTLAMEPGTWTTTATGRIVNTLADGKKQIFRPGQIASGNLNVTEGQPSIDLELPVTDDPDNSPSGGAITLTITFTGTGGGSEVYTISPLESWPTGTVGGSGGTDLATLLDPVLTPSAPPLVSVGVAGGVARLDSAGDVVNADGDKVKSAVSIRPEDHGAVGDGTTDDTAAVIAAFAAATALRRPGVAGNLKLPGATVLLQGRYSLATLAAPIIVSCNVSGSAGELIAPAAYSGTVLLVGHETSGSALQSADITLPDVMKPATGGPLVAGSVGVKVQNLYSSRLDFSRVAYFETALHFTGLGAGTAYNEIHLGWLSYSKISLKMAPGAGGWVNQNTFTGGGFQQSPGFDSSGYRRSGWRHLVMDGAGINGINGNTFVGVSFEGDVSETCIDIKQATQNTFYGCRFEPGRTGRTVSTASASSTVTLTTHGLVTGDAVVFGGTLPAELKVNVPYWVVSTATADTFTVSAAKGGTAITFAASTSTALLTQPHRVNVDATTYSSGEIHFIDSAATQKALDIVFQGSLVEGITQASHNQQSMDAFQDADRPLYRARNRSSGAVSRAAFAAYAPTVNPSDDPNGWTAAISDRGLLFAESRAEAGRVFGSGGTLFYRRPADTVSYEIPSCRRSPSLIAVTALSCAANTTTNQVVTLTDATSLDHVLVTPTDALPSGLALSHARVTAANTVTITFANLTGSTISLTANMQIIAFRRYY